MLNLTVIIGVFFSEVIALIVFVAFGVLLSAAAATDAAPGSSALMSVHEMVRAIGASAMFMILSGYVVSIAILQVIFRNRLLSLTHTGWVALLFLLHAAFFLFYLRGPAVLSSSLVLLAVGVLCVIAALATVYLLWRRWLLPRGRSM